MYSAKHHCRSRQSVITLWHLFPASPHHQLLTQVLRSNFSTVGFRPTRIVVKYMQSCNVPNLFRVLQLQKYILVYQDPMYSAKNSCLSTPVAANVPDAAIGTGQTCFAKCRIAHAHVLTRLEVLQFFRLLSFFVLPYSSIFFFSTGTSISRRRTELANMIAGIMASILSAEIDNCKMTLREWLVIVKASLHLPRSIGYMEKGRFTALEPIGHLLLYNKCTILYTKPKFMRMK